MEKSQLVCKMDKLNNHHLRNNYYHLMYKSIWFLVNYNMDFPSVFHLFDSLGIKDQILKVQENNINFLRLENSTSMRYIQYNLMKNIGQCNIFHMDN